MHQNYNYQLFAKCSNEDISKLMSFQPRHIPRKLNALNIFITKQERMKIKELQIQFGKLESETQNKLQ